MQSKIGESPVYNPKTNSLVYTDVVGEYQLWRYDLASKKTYRAKILGETEQLGFIIPFKCCTDKYAVGIGPNLKVVHWDGISTTAISCCTQLRTDPNIPTNHVHDAKVDSHGRVYIGTIRNDLCNPNSTAPVGGISRSDDGITTKVIVPNEGLTNDIIIDEKRNQLYWADTCRQVIKAYDWDPMTGDICKSSRTSNYLCCD